MMDLVLRWARLVGAFAVAWILLWAYNARGCQRVEGREMEPTLAAGKSAIVRPPPERAEDLERGDVVSFATVVGGTGVRTTAARVVGLPGDRVRIEKGELFVNGARAGTEAVAAANKTLDDYAEIIVPRDTVFVLCDNRKAGATRDSRALGPVPIGSLNGRF
jgi:signal peptidase I